MAHRASSFALAVFLTASSLHAQMPHIPGLPTGSASASTLSEGQIGSGIKDALSVGTQKAVTQVSHPGGYLENEAIKILLPNNLKPVEKGLRAAGQGPKVDAFIASMNHAAEDAAPEAGKIFGSAVKQMTIEDARKLLNGGDTSITTYFKDKTSADLTAAFRPHVEAAMQKNGVTQQYESLTASAPRMPFMKSQSMDINTYVVNKALEGLFYELAQQEKDIRTNPAARTTSILKQVFGSK